jgi:hypothetical protein
MADQQLESILKRLDGLTDEFSELKAGVQKAIRIANDDPEMALTRARKVLEYIVRDVYLRHCNEEPGTKPLENLLHRLIREGYVPRRLGAYANHIRELGNVGTHVYGEGVSVRDVLRSLDNLMAIIEWYFEAERPDAVRSVADEKPITIKNPEEVLRNELATVRGQMLAARSHWELEEVSFKLEDILNRYPAQPEALRLRSQLAGALRFETAAPTVGTAMPPSSHDQSSGAGGVNNWLRLLLIAAAVLGLLILTLMFTSRLFNK